MHTIDYSVRRFSLNQTNSLFCFPKRTKIENGVIELMSDEPFDCYNRVCTCLSSSRELITRLTKPNYQLAKNSTGREGDA
jgi:hypothetical protein